MPRPRSPRAEADGAGPIEPVDGPGLQVTPSHSGGRSYCR